MAEGTAQNKSNHVRYDPLFHFFLTPVLLLLLVWSLAHAVRYPRTESFYFAVVAIVLVVMAYKLRTYPLKVQDRVIRLEEKLRLLTLLPEPLRSRVDELQEWQLIALRFASDAELPALVERILREQLNRTQIKDSIRDWRPDLWRV